MQMAEKESLALTVVMPCLNEAAAVAFCVEEAKAFLTGEGLSGEILVVDNASEDGSASAAKEAGARVIREPVRGYGNALRRGIAHSRGRVIIMGDCDSTYDFSALKEMYGLMAEGRCDMVIGNRYGTSGEKGSISLSHRLGGRFLSYCARKRFHTDVMDFHCGLRGLTREAAERLTLAAGGMEFATEMIAEAAGQELCILQVPVSLRKSRFYRKSKLRTVRDGFRHLGYILRQKEKKDE